MTKVILEPTQWRLKLELRIDAAIARKYGVMANKKEIEGMLPVQPRDIQS